MAIIEKRYIGDGVYADFPDNYHVRLTTEDGMRMTNEIFLNPEVLLAFAAFADDLKNAITEANRKGQPPE